VGIELILDMAGGAVLLVRAVAGRRGSGRDRPGGNGIGAPLYAHASCCIMGKVRAVSGGRI
jgi:hypothetical protein